MTYDGNGAIDIAWVGKVKGGALDNRLTARGFKQEIGENDCFFAPTGAETSFRLFLLYAFVFNLEVRLFDVSRAFLHATIDPDLVVIVKPPPEWLSLPGNEGKF